MYLGLTGGIASGKNTVAEMFKNMGAYTIDADKISKEIMAPGGKAYDDVINTFGDSILDEQANINRKKLKEIVFNDISKREKLESIVHPAILAEEKRIVGRIKGKDDKALIITHAALIIEKGTFKRFDGVIVVFAEKEQQIERLMERDNIGREYAESIVDSQMSVNEKLKFADFIVDNSLSVDETYQDVKRVYEALKIYMYCDKQLKKVSGK